MQSNADTSQCNSVLRGMQHMPASFAGFTGGAFGQERHERVAHLPAQRAEEEAGRLVEALLIAQ
jgi:hypothetical protein